MNIKFKLSNIEQAKQPFLNKDLKEELLKSKDKIYDLDRIKIPRGTMWTKLRSLLNKYENVPFSIDENGRFSKKKMNRAYFKLKELMLDDKEKFTKLKSAACLAEGPGGFIQFITDYYPKAKIYGITLKYDDDKEHRNMEKFLEKNPNVKIIYGNEEEGHDGNLYNKEVVNAFANKVGKVDLVTADGGFQASDENEKETEHLRLFLAETLTAFKVLNKGGSFILKIYDIFTRATVEMLFLLSNVFGSVEIKKPVTSRPANSERYVVCHNFKGFETDKHVKMDDDFYYEKILKMTEVQEEMFKLFAKNLENKDREYVNMVKNNIDEIINFYHVNSDNRMAKLEKEKEQNNYKRVWEAVYEKND